MRIDLLLCRLRFAKSRRFAQRWIGEGHIRCNGERVTRNDRPVAAGDVLTLPIGRGVQIISIDALPERRGPAGEARTHYHNLAGIAGAGT
ncbi:S4 domain-containing protein [Aurantiacibacter atlanticus]|uniref:S4 domain-containing protein n=1 Tax=Aurantiacibacter atlanticus TaxID=1648404 RepID=A0A0H4V930_9SPHN|nr:S4 domain-containing protein [Aurantiacibacter atlanticus]AKQ41117.1 S4 domain-containing protein [Aurantiacibacter atlanticus]MDF1833453.1 S4 domain-containing protein [Alteraurantiacibacter sp. bin_em_oilr2.035]